MKVNQPEPDWDFDTHDDWTHISMAEINRACDAFLASRGDYSGEEAQRRFARNAISKKPTM
jgi:hypothetical protein